MLRLQTKWFLMTSLLMQTTLTAIPVMAAVPPRLRA